VDAKTVMTCTFETLTTAWRIVAIVLGNTMTAVSVSARLALDALKLRAGEVEAALSLG
jgi:ABC-type iron transport system FetAB permease component